MDLSRCSLVAMSCVVVLSLRYEVSSLCVVVLSLRDEVLSLCDAV